MMRLSRLRPLRSKKWLLIGLSALLVLTLGSYILWSQQTWGQLTPAYTQWHQSIKTDIDKINALPVTTSAEQDGVVAKLVDISNKINTDRHTICTTHPLVQWQQKFISAFHDTYSACQKLVAVTVEFQKRLAIVITYSNDEQALAKIISTAPQAGELADDAWEQQVVMWAEAAEATQKLSVTDDFKSTQQLAIEHMTGIEAAWQEVIAAHHAKDKQKYLAAQDSLATAIDNLNEIPVMSQASFTKLSDGLSEATQKAFGK